MYIKILPKMLLSTLQNTYHNTDKTCLIAIFLITNIVLYYAYNKGYILLTVFMGAYVVICFILRKYKNLFTLYYFLHLLMFIVLYLTSPSFVPQYTVFSINKATVHSVTQSGKGHPKLLLRNISSTIPQHINSSTAINVIIIPNDSISDHKVSQKFYISPGNTIKLRHVLCFPRKNSQKTQYCFTKQNPKILANTKNNVSWLSHLRKRIANNINNLPLNSSNKSLVHALLLGDKSTISSDTFSNIRSAGIAHILAISGMHIMLVFGCVFWVLCKLLIICASNLVLKYNIRKISGILTFIVVCGYVILSGAAVSSQRALLFLLFIVTSIALDKKLLSLHMLGVTTIFLLFINPMYVFSISFQMSFLTVAGLINIYKYLQNNYDIQNLKPRWFLYILLLTLSCIVAGMLNNIISSYYFHQISVYNVLFNIIVIPILATIIMPIIIFIALTMPLDSLPIIPSVIHIMSYVLNEALSIILRGATIVSHLPYSHISVLGISGEIWTVLTLGTIFLIIVSPIIFLLSYIGWITLWMYLPYAK